MQLYVSKNGQRYGPYSLQELRREVLANVFRPEHFASSDNGRTWEPISSVPGIGPLAYAVEADGAQNLLIIRYRGYVRSSAVERCAREVASSLTCLRPGFRLLADFTDLEEMDVACAPHLEQIMQLCNEKGVSAVVRAIPDPRRDIGLQIMSYFHYGPEVRITTCRSLEEAYEILARQLHHSERAAAPDSSEP
jgi:anti-anti-sigma regulatory factor